MELKRIYWYYVDKWMNCIQNNYKITRDNKLRQVVVQNTSKNKKNFSDLG